MTITRITTGRKGEGLALAFLKKQGYKIIEKNYRTKFGEVDVIAKDKSCICFIEVRSMNTEKFGGPEYTVDKKKQNHIAKMALLYIKRYGLENKQGRFDVVCIKDINTNSPKIRLIKNAFELDGRYGY